MDLYWEKQMSDDAVGVDSDQELENLQLKIHDVERDLKNEIERLLQVFDTQFPPLDYSTQICLSLETMNMQLLKEQKQE